MLRTVTKGVVRLLMTSKIVIFSAVICLHITGSVRYRPNVANELFILEMARDFYVTSTTLDSIQLV